MISLHLSQWLLQCSNMHNGFLLDILSILFRQLLLHPLISSKKNGHLHQQASSNAIFDENHSFINIGLCFRGEGRNYISLEPPYSVACIPNPLEAEAWAMKHVVQWISDLGYQNVIFESDCQMVVDCYGGDDSYCDIYLPGLLFFFFFFSYRKYTHKPDIPAQLKKIKNPPNTIRPISRC